MADSNLLPTVATVILSGGAGAFVISVARSWTTLRRGARARERETINDLMARAEDAEERERVAARDRDYWRQVTGSYGWQLRSAGITPNPPDPVQPSDQVPPPRR